MDKGAKRNLLVYGAIVICAVLGAGSAWLMGGDNPFEESAEKVINKTVEMEFSLPPNTVNIDLTPGSKEG